MANFWWKKVKKHQVRKTDEVLRGMLCPCHPRSAQWHLVGTDTTQHDRMICRQILQHSWQLYHHHWGNIMLNDEGHVQTSDFLRPHPFPDLDESAAQRGSPCGLWFHVVWCSRWEGAHVFGATCWQNHRNITGICKKYREILYIILQFGSNLYMKDKDEFWCHSCWSYDEKKTSLVSLFAVQE